MQVPRVFVAQSKEQGLQCAIAYLESGSDAYGWYIGRRHDGSYASAYFLIENLFAEARPRYEKVDDASLHSHWSLDEARRHELARMQDVFAREWLEFGAGTVGVRPGQLGKLAEGTFYSRDFERPVLNFLSGHWPLEYRPDSDRIAAEQERRRAGHARP